MLDSDELAPLDLFEYEDSPGRFSLLLSADRMGEAQEEVFGEFGQDGGGDGWEAVARSAVRAHAPEIADRLDYDPEAGMFVAYGTDREALARLDTLLRDAYHDADTLRELLRTADPEWFD